MRPSRPSRHLFRFGSVRTRERAAKRAQLSHSSKEADDDAGGEGGAAAPEVTPRRLHCDVKLAPKIPDLGVGTAPRPLLPQQSW